MNQTALHVAALFDRHKVVKKLLQMGADHKALNFQNYTSLELAKRNRKKNAEKVLQRWEEKLEKEAKACS